MFIDYVFEEKKAEACGGHVRDKDLKGERG